MSKEDLERNHRALDMRLKIALPPFARALKIHRDAVARALEEYLLPYEHEGPPMFAGVATTYEVKRS